MQNAAKLQWKYRDLIDALGGPKGVAQQFACRGVRPPPIETIKGWQVRNSVPGRYAPLLIMVGEEQKCEGSNDPILRCVADLWGGFGS